MELVRRNNNSWDPFDLLSDLQTDLNRVFNRSLTKSNAWERGFSPSIELQDENDHFLVSADVPGLKKEDLNISVEGNLLTLQGERKIQQEKKEKGYQYSEKFYGKFTRVVELPTEIQADKVKAAYKDGVLEITLPKSENAKPKKIDVEVK